MEPRPSPEQPVRDWTTAAIFAVVAAAGLFSLPRLIESLERTIKDPQLYPSQAGAIWTWASIVALASAGVVYLGAAAGAELSIGRRARPAWSRLRFGALIAIGVALVSLGLSNLVYYQWFAPRGWHELFSNRAALAGLWWGVGAVVAIVAPSVLLYFRPALASSRAL